ncbi:hypothetical protein ACFX2J_025304 [Malus domestica]
MPSCPKPQNLICCIHSDRSESLKERNEMPWEDAQLIAAKKAYQNAKAVGNHEEEARWANAIGDLLKKSGEYVAALVWFRIDYDVSVK